MNNMFVASDVNNARIILSDLHALERPLTKEEKIMGRRAAQVVSEYRKAETIASAERLHETELNAMLRLGYSKQDAEEELRIAAQRRYEAAGFGRSKRCRFVRLKNN
ncbi:MAG: hypothetical protein Q4D80_02455 [Pseudomonadota bacterium]|nr:hypothetical protein [Pseudomonadota bacterium]